jgi:septation ring formation regulator EzrA
MRRADLAERIDSVEHRMDSMEQRLDTSFNALSTQILQSRRENDDAHLAMHARFEKIETAIADSRADMNAQGTDLRAEIREGDEETRRFMMILHEDTLSKIALIGEGRRSSML